MTTHATYSHIKLTAADPYHLVNSADPSRTECGEPINQQSAVDVTDKPGNKPQCVMCRVKRPNARTLQEEWRTSRLQRPTKHE